MKLYTKGGDGGTTSLIGGERAAKFDIRVEAYGSVDELSAQTAMLRDRLAEAGIADFEEDLVTILRRLMTIESLLALGEGYEGDKVPDLSDEEIAEIELRIDAVSELLTPIRYFTLPGGHPLVSQAHICRTVCRRVERRACRAAAEYTVSARALTYLNRLSDYFYAVGRRLTYLLHVEETLWIP